MRITTIKGELGYLPPDHSCRYEVFLDDRSLPLCFLADEAEGVAWVYRVDQTGTVMQDALGQPLKQRLLGKVEIRLRGGPYG